MRSCKVESTKAQQSGVQLHGSDAHLERVAVRSTSKRATREDCELSSTCCPSLLSSVLSSEPTAVSTDVGSIKAREHSAGDAALTQRSSVHRDSGHRAEPTTDEMIAKLKQRRALNANKALHSNRRCSCDCTGGCASDTIEGEGCLCKNGLRSAECGGADALPVHLRRRPSGGHDNAGTCRDISTAPLPIPTVGRPGKASRQHRETDKDTSEDFWRRRMDLHFSRAEPIKQSASSRPCQFRFEDEGDWDDFKASLTKMIDATTATALHSATLAPSGNRLEIRCRSIIGLSSLLFVVAIITTTSLNSWLIV